MYKAIHTIPRSGTYWIVNFLNYYKTTESLDNEIDSKCKLNIDMAHRYLPGKQKYLNCCEFESPKVVTAKMKIIKSALKDRSARIILIYRNPLSQAASHYDHNYVQPHLNPESTGNIKCSNEFEFLMGFMPTYLRFYFSHLRWKNKLPKCVSMISYEQLKIHPILTFSKIIQFLEPSVFNLESIKKSINETTIEKLQDQEKIIGKTLANDLHYNKDISHIQNGDVKSWEGHFTKEEINLYSNELKKHGVDLNSFDGIGEI